MTRRIVIVDDDVLIATFLEEVCVSFGHDVCGVAHDCDSAVAIIETQKPDFVLMDVRLGGARDGIDISLQIYKSAPEIKTIFVTGSNEPETIKRIGQDHPHAVMIKPIIPSKLEEILAAA